MKLKIVSHELTDCGVTTDGDTIRLDLIDQTGLPVSLQLPFEQAEAVAMTLPHLLSLAVKAKVGDVTASYVFPLGHWRLERPQSHEGLMLTLMTSDGFQVSFGIPTETCAALGWALKHEAQNADAAVDFGGPESVRPVRVN